MTKHLKNFDALTNAGNILIKHCVCRQPAIHKWCSLLNGQNEDVNSRLLFDQTSFQMLHRQAVDLSILETGTYPLFELRTASRWRRWSLRLGKSCRSSNTQLCSSWKCRRTLLSPCKLGFLRYPFSHIMLKDVCTVFLFPLFSITTAGV